MSEEKNEVYVPTKLESTALAADLSSTFGLTPAQLVAVIGSQIISVPPGADPPSQAEIAIVMSTMNKYDLDPMVREVSAWRDNKGKLCVAVEMNGWIKITNRQKGYMRTTSQYGPIVPSPDNKGKPCYEWVQSTVHDSVRGELVGPRVYLDEWYVPQRGNYAGNWQKYTKFRLEQRSINISKRFAYGIGVYDEFDKEQMVQEPVETTAAATSETISDLTAVLEARGESVEDAVVEDDGENTPDVPLDGVSDSRVPDDQEEEKSAEGPTGGGEFCSAVGCAKGGTFQCSECLQFYCSEHTGENGMCKICGGG